MKRLLFCVTLATMAGAVWAPFASAANPGINALYVQSRSGRQITFGCEGSIVTYRARAIGWNDSLMSWAQTEITDVDVAANRAYVCAGSRGLRILDVGNPARAYELGAWETGALANRVSAQGAYAYVADLHVVTVLDVSNPAAPQQVSSFWVNGDGAGIDDVQVVGNYAYVAGYVPSSSYPFTHQNYLLVFDVSNPANPVWMGSTAALARTSTPMRIAVRGTRVYVGGSFLCIVDVSDPSNPSYLSYGWSGSSKKSSLCAGPAVDGRYAFVASDDKTAVFQITSRIPRYFGSMVASWPYSTGVGVALTEPGARKRYALVAFDKAGDLNGFVEILDASRPLRLDHDHGEVKGSGSGGINCVTVSGDWAYMGRASDSRPNLVIAHLGPTAYSWVLDKRRSTVPDRRADAGGGLKASITASVPSAGRWYFHVRARGTSGWGPAATIAIRVQ